MNALHPLPRSVLVCGPARNCARTIRNDVEHLRAATAWIPKVQFLVVESDSSDSTVTTLNELARSWPALQVITLGALRERMPGRTDRIAHARNTCLEALRGDPRYADVDHLIMADLDGMCRDLEPASLRSCWQLAVPWDACTANQGDHYYDVWALRHPVWCPRDVWSDHAALLALFGEPEATQLAIFSRMVHIPRSAAPIEVDSGFGGLALYKRAALDGLRYEGRTADGAPLCEHVALHLAMRARGGRIFIHPGLINARKTKHAGRKKFWRTLRRRVWNGLRGHGWR